uniref:Histone chaperone domain-containing protein n=1 Tax=Dunaliella tertiolecta TaxID=3047 RepID=A0A7S3R619_DUNTE
MSTAPPPPGIRDALLNRRKEIRKRLDVLNGKAVRRMLESDLGLEAKQLDPFKALVDNLIDEVVIGRSKDSQEDSQQQPPDTQPSRDQGDKYNDLAVTKDQARKPTPKTKAEPKAKPARKKASAQRKSKGLSDDESGEEEEEDTGSGSGSDEDQEVRPPPRKVSKANAKPAVKEPAGGPKFSKQVERLREICKKATIKIPPALYKRGPDGSEDRMLEGLEGLLAKHGLDANSKDSEIKAAKKQIERMRELEGIDTSNIMEAAGRRPRRAAASINFRAIYNQMGEGDSDAEGQEEEEMEQLRGGSKGGGSSEEGGEDAARGGQTKRRSKGSAGGGAQKRGRSADAHDMQGWLRR